MVFDEMRIRLLIYLTFNILYPTPFLMELMLMSYIPTSINRLGYLIRGFLLSKIISFIEDLQQIVTYKDNNKMNYYNNKCYMGVPQESHLVTILFLIFINDINLQN